MTDHNETPAVPGAAPPAASSPRASWRMPRSPLLAGLVGLGLLAAGAVAGAAGYGMLHGKPPTFDPAMATTPIAQLSDDDRTEIQGKVVEIFGNKFVLEDGSGRALVETGRAGEGGTLVAANETVTVQGRFDDGFVRASALQRADGKVEELRPMPHPPRRERR